VHLSVGRGIALDNADFSWFVLLMPTAAPALAALTERSVVHQERRRRPTRRRRCAGSD
jgi:hypothetical protein